MWDDFSNFTSCPSSVTKCPLHNTKVFTWGGCEMSFQISPCIYLVWPSVPSTTPKFSCKVHARWLFKSHLASTQDDIRKVYKGKFLQIFLMWPWDIEEVTSNSNILMQVACEMTYSNITLHPSSMTKCPLQYTKVLMQGACEMTFQISPHINLAWLSVSSTKEHVRWLFKSHLTSI